MRPLVLRHKAFAICTLAASFALSGCGGGGGGTDTTSSSSVSAQGMWTGSSTNGRGITGIVLSDGTYYVLYSSTSNRNTVAGVVQGNGAINGSTFASTNGRDFNLEGLGVLQANVSATATTKSALNGTIGYSNGAAVSFTSSYDNYFDSAPSLSAAAGTFTGSVALSAGVQAASLTLTSSGSFTGSGSGCNFSGTVTPRSEGNVFNATVRFGASPCFFANQTLTGVMLYDSRSRRAYAVAPNSARSDGVIFVGTKP